MLSTKTHKQLSPITLMHYQVTTKISLLYTVIWITGSKASSLHWEMCPWHHPTFTACYITRAWVWNSRANLVNDHNGMNVSMCDTLKKKIFTTILQFRLLINDLLYFCSIITDYRILGWECTSQLCHSP